MRAVPASGVQLPDLPGFHRPDIKAFLHHRGLVWAGSRQGLYRIGSGVAEFLPEWQDRGEVLALGPATNGFWVAHRRDGVWSLSACDDHARPHATVSFGIDDLTCLAEAFSALWVGGKKNLYRREGLDWQPVLPERLTGPVEWVREIEGALFVAVGKSEADGCPRLVRGDGRHWRECWSGPAGERIRATDGRRFFCKWTGDQDRPTLLAKPILAAAFFDDGGYALLQSSTLTVADRTGRDVLRLHDDRWSRGLWLARDNHRIITAGEQGLWAFDLASHHWSDLTERGNGPRRASRIKHIWNAGPGRFLLCATHGTFSSNDSGLTWNRVVGAPDILHSRRLFRTAAGTLALATRDGIFQSDDGGNEWRALTWAGDGIRYDKLSGVALVGRTRVFGGKKGLFIQAAGETARLVPALADRRIEDVVADSPARLLVLCHGGEVFTLDLLSGMAELLIQVPAADARSLVCTPDGTYVLGRKTLFHLGSDAPNGIPLPLPDQEFSLSIGGGRCAALGGPGAWIASVLDWRWQPVEHWPEGLKKPSGALSDDGKTLIFTDNHRFWRWSL